MEMVISSVAGFGKRFTAAWGEIFSKPKVILFVKVYAPALFIVVTRLRSILNHSSSQCGKRKARGKH